MYFISMMLSTSRNRELSYRLESQASSRDLFHRLGTKLHALRVQSAEGTMVFCPTNIRASPHKGGFDPSPYGDQCHVRQQVK